MATKSIKKIEQRSLRVTRSSFAQCQPLEPLVQQPPSCNESQQSDNNNQFCIQNYEQLKLKPEKQSTSPLNHEANPLQNISERVRPITRSKSSMSCMVMPSMEMGCDQATPEQNNIHKSQQIATSKKTIKINTEQQLIDIPSIEITQTVKKSISKISQQVISPYSQFRKSYRKLHKRQIISIPYRKCHDALQGRIITIMNKIQLGKNCSKDFESLIEKMGKITSKDIMNRYIISGIKTIIAIAIHKNIYDPKIIHKLQQEEQLLQEKIKEQLDNFDEFKTINQAQSNIDQHQYKNLMLRKIYRFMKQNQPNCSREQLRRKLITECMPIFNGDPPVNLLLKFTKNKIESLK